ncbi:MAG: AraC family ligand binding domain-containing protein [Sphingomonadales bacterium]
MTTTFIDTNKIQPVTLPGGQGKYAEILNNDLCGAKNVVGSLRWLNAGEHITAACDADTHQIVYLMEGEGVIRLNGSDYEVGKGAGVYLGPSEKADIAQAGAGSLKLFHLVVPHQKG